MPKVTNNQLKGNFGAAYVAARLSTQCLVRPVATETDVGVDLYCETVKDGQPHLHFWVQVKTGKQCQLSEDGFAVYPFETQHLEYWDRQPVAVFAALIPTTWPVLKDPPIHIVEITKRRLEGDKSNTLHATLKWEGDSQACVTEFLEKTVPETTAMQSCKLGIISSIPVINRQYEQKIPFVPVELHSGAILEQLRKTAAFSIICLWKRNALNTPDPKFRRTLARVSEQLTGSGNWETFMALALSHHADREFAKAKQNYELAMESILGDPNLKQHDYWRKQVHEIEAQVAKADQSAPV